MIRQRSPRGVQHVAEELEVIEHLLKNAELLKYLPARGHYEPRVKLVTDSRCAKHGRSCG